MKVSSTTEPAIAGSAYPRLADLAGRQSTYSLMLVSDDGDDAKRLEHMLNDAVEGRYHVEQVLGLGDAMRAARNGDYDAVILYQDHHHAFSAKASLG